MAVAKNTAEFIKSRGPAYVPKNVLTTGDPHSVRFTSMTDSTLTVVQITLYGEVIGTGIARRHPRDARDRDLGMALAVSRAFMDAGTRYAGTVDQMLNPEPDPSGAAIRELRRLGKADRKRRKAIRRKAAREAHREAYGWDHTSPPARIEEFKTYGV